MCIKDDIAQRIEAANPDEIFFISDFATNGNDEFISHNLSELVAEGKVMRLANGIYYKPVRTRFGELKPSVDTIVRAIARRDKAQILPTGAAAENMLGLSTQIPMNYVYLTSGSARRINLDIPRTSPTKANSCPYSSRPSNPSAKTTSPPNTWQGLRLFSPRIPSPTPTPTTSPSPRYG